jgi:hypothetical protein
MLARRRLSARGEADLDQLTPHELVASLGRKILKRAAASISVASTVMCSSLNKAQPVRLTHHLIKELAGGIMLAPLMIVG